MYQFFILFTALSFYFLSVLAAPLPSGHSLNKRNTGRGTWFYDGLGACGYENINSDSIIAVSHLIYNGGEYCNRWVSVTNTATNEQAYGQIRDECESCGQGDLDMSQGLFTQIGKLSTGVLAIDWELMPEGWTF